MRVNLAFTLCKESCFFLFLFLSSFIFHVPYFGNLSQAPSSPRFGFTSASTCSSLRSVFSSFSLFDCLTCAISIVCPYNDFLYLFLSCLFFNILVHHVHLAYGKFRVKNHFLYQFAISVTQHPFCIPFPVFVFRWLVGFFSFHISFLFHLIYCKQPSTDECLVNEEKREINN